MELDADRNLRKRLLRRGLVRPALVAAALMTVVSVAASGNAFAFQAEGDAAPAESTTEAADDRVVRESFLGWMVRSSGIFGFILLLISFVMVALIAMNVMQVRRDILIPPLFIEEFEEKIEAKDYQGAFELAREDESFIGRVMTAGLSKLSRGYNAALEGMQEVGEDENMSLEHRLSYLKLIGSIAPMLGLMGTVYGMIQSFQRIATSTTSPKPAELAEGISTALFTTLEGLTVAIPALIAYSLLRNRVSRFMLEVGILSENLLGRFPAGGKTQSAPAKAAASSASAASKG